MRTYLFPSCLKYAALWVGACLAVAPAPAADYYWDANGGTGSTGGTGTWDTTSSLWRNGGTGGALGVWPNPDPSTSTAVFGDVVGAVTIANDTTIYANGLNFSNVADYTPWRLQSGNGASRLVLSGPTNTITVGTAAGNYRQFSAVFNTQVELRGTTTLNGTTATRMGIGVNPLSSSTSGNLTIASGGIANFFSSGVRAQMFAVGHQAGLLSSGVSSVTGSADFTGGRMSLYTGNLTVGAMSTDNTGAAHSATVTGTFTSGTDSGSVLDSLGVSVVGQVWINHASATYVGTASGTLNWGGGTATFNNNLGSDHPALHVGRFLSTASTNATNVAAASGTLNISGGTVNMISTNDNVLFLASRSVGLHANSTASGTVNLTGGTLNITGGDIYGGTGSSATSTVTLDGGTLDLNGNDLGRTGGLITTLNFRSGTLRDVYEINAGATLNKTTAGTLTLSGFNRYTGGTTISEGSVSAGNIVVNTGYSDLGNSATAVGLGAASTQGTLSYTGNTATYIRGFTIGNGGGQLDVTTSGQTLTVGTGAITGTAGHFTVGGAGNTTITSAITTTTGGLTKTGAGTLTLTNSGNAYTGDTIVSQGTLVLSGSGAVASHVIQVQQGAFLTASSGLQLQSGQTLENKGTFTGNLTALSGSTYAPGNSPGIATQAGDLTFNTGSTFEWELIANTDAVAGTNFDQTVFTSGGLTIQTGVTANLVFNAGSTVDWANAFWGSDQQWLVFSGASSLSNVAGIFTSITVGADAFSQSLASARSGATFSFTNVGNDVYLTYSIPEPSITLLLTGGLMATLFLRRRSRKVCTEDKDAV